MKTPDSEPDMSNDAWDDLFRQRLADYTDQPPTDSLFRILAGAGRSHTRFYRRFIPLSLAMILLTGVGTWLFISQSETTLEAVANKRTPLPSVKQTRLKGDDVTARKATENQVAMDEHASAKPATATSPLMNTSPERVMPDLSAALGVTKRGRLTNKTNGLQTTVPADKELKVAYQELVNHSSRRGNTAGNTPDIRLSRVPEMSSTKNRADGSSILSPGYLKTNEATFSEQQLPITQALPINTDLRLPSINRLAGRAFRALETTTTLPIVAAAIYEQTAETKASKPIHRQSWFASLTPLYNYQRINPIHTDAEFVSDIRVSHPLSPNRLGGRLQLGMEWQLTNRISLRTSLVYQQVRQSLHYDVRSTRPDSVHIVATDNQSVQVTPVFTKRNCEETAIWHYTGVSTDVVWQLNRTSGRRWQHYLTAGATVGHYVSRGGSVNGFVQAAYGIERPLTSNLRLRIEPTIQLGWEALTDQAKRFNNRPYSYGFAMGVRFR